jgi:hypothetical protein
LERAQQPIVTAAKDTREQFQHLGHPGQKFELHQTLRMSSGAAERRIVRNATAFAVIGPVP